MQFTSDLTFYFGTALLPEKRENIFMNICVLWNIIFGTFMRKNTHWFFVKIFKRCWDLFVIQQNLKYPLSFDVTIKIYILIIEWIIRWKSPFSGSVGRMVSALNNRIIFPHFPSSFRFWCESFSSFLSLPHGRLWISMATGSPKWTKMKISYSNPDNKISDRKLNSQKIRIRLGVGTSGKAPFSVLV